MFRWLLRLFGMKMAQRALVGGKGRVPMIDIGLGFALLRDRNVPIRSKLAALGLGGLAIAALMALEAPVELLIGMLFNIPGVGLDMMVDGLEILTGPVLVASLLLPRLVPAHIVEQVRAARAGIKPQSAYVPQCVSR